MYALQTVDYLRLRRLARRTLQVGVPAASIPRHKRRDCPDAQRRLRESLQEQFNCSGRRRFRRDVAIHTTLHEPSISEAPRIVKACLDALQGVAYADDVHVGLLDVRNGVAASGSKSAVELSLCSISEYAEAYDILRGAFQDAGDDDWDDRGELSSHLDPWAKDPLGFPADISAETARDHLEWVRSVNPDYPKELLQFDERCLRAHAVEEILGSAYSPADRPGPPSVASRIWSGFSDVERPNAVQLAVPRGEPGSFRAVVRQKIQGHAERWAQPHALLGDSEISLDISVGEDSGCVFDLDNLAHRVTRAFAKVHPQLRIGGYRVYRRSAPAGCLVIQIADARRAARLARLFVRPQIFGWQFHGDKDVAAYRRRPRIDALIAARGTEFAGCWE